MNIRGGGVMNKAMLGLLTVGLALASVAANAESEMAKHRLRAGEVAFNDSRAFAGDRDGREGRDARDARSDRSFEASRQITKPRAVTQPTAVAAPEIDPTSAAAGLTLLLGGIAVLLGRRTRPD